MAELIDPTWLAWSASSEYAEGRAQDSIERVRAHYSAISPDPLEAETWIGPRAGTATLRGAGNCCRWPGFAVGEGIVSTWGYIPWGWRRHHDAEPGAAAIELARRIASSPAGGAELIDPPALLAVVDTTSGELTIINDRLGAARLFEMEHQGLTVWSNRLGALPLFAGVAPRADEQGWKTFAAAGWFIGDRTAIAGASRVAPASVIRITRAGVARTSGDPASVVASRDSRQELLERLVADSRTAVASTAELFDEPPRVDLSGGRDSRLVAAAAVSSGVEIRLSTSDLTPGEADVAKALVAALPQAVDHRIEWAEGRKVYELGLRERAGANHLLHDGMRHAAKVRGKMTLPPPRPDSASLSGHGGEIGHGFYYTSEAMLGRLEAGGMGALLDRLDRAARRRHAAGRPDAYELAHDIFATSFATGESIGLSGPELLDWFYLTQRFPHRSGLAADSCRLVLFARAGFVQAAFALGPRERLEARLHRAAITALVPAWAEVPFFAKRKQGRLRALLGRGRYLPDQRRDLIWEGEDAAEVEAMIAAGGAWTEMFDPDRVRELWRAARGGKGDAHYQDVFEGIAYREAFEDHLAVLARAAA